MCCIRMTFREFVRSVYGRLYEGNPEFDLDDVLALVRSSPELTRTSTDGVRNAALEGLDTGAMRKAL